MSTTKQETLQEEFQHIESQARMILPGIQALVGFQFIAVFNESFRKILSSDEQKLHLLSLCFCVGAVFFSLISAAYHRIAEPGQISRGLIKLGSITLTIGMALLAVAMAIDVYLVARIILDDAHVALYLASGTFVMFILGWFVVPGYGRCCIRQRQAKKG